MHIISECHSREWWSQSSTIIALVTRPALAVNFYLTPHVMCENEISIIKGNYSCIPYYASIKTHFRWIAQESYPSSVWKPHVTLYIHYHISQAIQHGNKPVFSLYGIEVIFIPSCVSGQGYKISSVRLCVCVCTLNKNHWMVKANPWSLCCEGNSLSNDGIFMILLPQYFPGWIKIYVWVRFSKENTVEAGLEDNPLVKSTRYLIVIYFQGGIFRPNRPVFNLMNLYGLDTLQLTQEKGKSSVAQCSTEWFFFFFFRVWGSMVYLVVSSEFLRAHIRINLTEFQSCYHRLPEAAMHKMLKYPITVHVAMDWWLCVE